MIMSASSRYGQFLSSRSLSISCDWYPFPVLTLYFLATFSVPIIIVVVPARVQSASVDVRKALVFLYL